MIDGGGFVAEFGRSDLTDQFGAPSKNSMSALWHFLEEEKRQQAVLSRGGTGCSDLDSRAAVRREVIVESLRMRTFSVEKKIIEKENE